MFARVMTVCVGVLMAVAPATAQQRGPMVPTAVLAVATMRQLVDFERDSTSLSDAAKSVLDAKVTVFLANLAVRIVISGYETRPGTEEHNLAVGLRRADAAKAYLVSQGVAAVRIDIATRGEGVFLVEGPSSDSQAASRRHQFRVLLSESSFVPSRK